MKQVIYHIRMPLFVLGWMWIGIGYAWALATFVVQPSFHATLGFFAHTVFDVCFGMFHLWVVEKSKEWK